MNEVLAGFNEVLVFFKAHPSVAVGAVGALIVAFFRLKPTRPVQMGIQCPSCGSEEVDETSTPTFRCLGCGYSPDEEQSPEQSARLLRIQQISIAVMACRSANQAFSNSYRRQRQSGQRSKIKRDGAEFLDGMEYVAEAHRIAVEFGFQGVLDKLGDIPTLHNHPTPAARNQAMQATEAALALLEAQLQEARMSSS